MRLAMRRPRLPRLYPLKSKPRDVRRNSRRSSSPGSTSASVPSVIGVDALLVDDAHVGDRLAHEAGAPSGVRCLALVAARAVPAAALLHPLRDAPGEIGPLLEGYDGAPEGRFQCLALFGEQALGRVGVAHPAPESE